MNATEVRGQAGGPLSGITVLDLSRLVAGNMLTLLLADFGASVIKVEQPGRGDALRDWRVNGVPFYWKVYARNKKSITLNLQHEKGRDMLLGLAAKANVLIENFRPGTMQRLGVGYDVLHERNPQLVVISISGWGQDGPYAHRPGYGTLVEAMSGFASMNGFEDRPPVLPPVPLADMVAGLYGAAACLMALRHVEVAGGRGQVIDLPLLDPLLSILGPEAAIYEYTGRVKKRTGNRSSNSAPRNAYKTKDGKWLAISASMQVMAERLFRCLDLGHLLDDPRFRTNADRVQNAEELDRILQEKIGQRTLEENIQFFTEAEVTAAPIYDVSQLLQDPHVQAREVIIRFPDEDIGKVAMHNVVPRLSETPGEVRTPAPRLGEHNEEIYGGLLGLSVTDLQHLEQEGVI